jgi:hypothetical protein
MFRPLTVLLVTFLMAVPAAAQHRLSAPPIREVQGASGVSGIGVRRSVPHRFEARVNEAGGRQFERSFDITTNAQFRTHNLDDPASLLQTDSLYNNPWYWQHIGSLQTEMMTGGSGTAHMDGMSNGDYYNPFFYDQWKTSEGMRHSGALTSEMGAGDRGAVNRMDDRSGGPAKLPGTNEPLYTPQQVRFGLDADRSVLSGNRLGTTLRASIDDTWDGRIERNMGRGLVGDGVPVRYVGSQLRGLATRPVIPGALDRGLTSYDIASVRDDSLAGRPTPPMGQTWDTRFGDLAMASNRLASTRVADTSVASTLVQVPIAGDLAGIYQSMADRYGSLAPGSMSIAARLERLDREYRMLRGRLITGLDQLPSGTLPSDLGLRTPDALPAPGPSRTSDSGDLAGKGSTAEPTTKPRPLDVQPVLTYADYGLVLQHGQTVNSLAAGDGGRFDDLVTSAAKKLSSGDYLRAERRFNRALRLVPGHPLARAGLGHAQLGAGLYLSSALTLQTLLAFQPEMIDTDFAAKLLPAPEDLDRAISMLNDRLQGDADLDRYGFLLAYIGHQLDRPSLVSTGINAMRQANADEDFVALLEQVWAPAEHR